MRIVIETIPHNLQRYNTCGDWQSRKSPSGESDVRIFVSKMPKAGWRGEMLVAIHELVEMLLCKHHEVPEEMVDDWDKNYPDEGPYDEPGDDPESPYHLEHSFATGIEKILAETFGVIWGNYDNEIRELSDSYEEKEKK